ncbi:uncharacterized protein LOC131890851 [Tigriopus californicus]|uniref:uncharacterized protein LOC131890851 n=1 Tax=Tigriopus californicus TaxID=6832 RepID=UPI0027DA2D1F|nr:uncharacterized protein LOC131890851 [Tigriopus californicus]
MAQLIFLLILSLDVAFGIEKVRQGDLNEDGKDDREPKMFSHKTTGRDFSSTQDSTVLSILREDDQTYENVISGFSCRSRQQGYYPEVRTSCSIYYLCYHQRGSDMLRITFVCPEGYKYDPNSYQCRKGYVVNCQVGFAPLREQPKLMKNPIPFDVNNEFYIDDPGHFPGKSSKSYKLNSRYDFNYKPEVWYGRTQLSCVTCCKPATDSSYSKPDPVTPKPWTRPTTTKRPWTPRPTTTTRRPWTPTTTTWRPPSSWVVTPDPFELPDLDISQVQTIQAKDSHKALLKFKAYRP